MNPTLSAYLTLICFSLFACASLPGQSQQPTSSSPTTPEWIARLFPDTGTPDRLEHRLRRIDAGEEKVEGRIAGWVIAELIYPDMLGHDHKGHVKIYLPPALHDDPTRHVPLIHNAGYEADDKGASGLLAQGYAVCTPHAEPVHPLCRHSNLDAAILHAARRLPFIDPLHVSIQGGSAGGWMTLLLAADAFPLVSIMPDVPLIHFGYNIAYLDACKTIAAAHGGASPGMPFLAVVAGISDQVRPFYGMPYESATYFTASPLAHLDTITAPVLVTFSTADVLVPIDQVGAQLAQPRNASLFPTGYSTAMSDRFPGIGENRTLLKALSASQVALFQTPLPADLPRERVGGKAPAGLKPIPLPFSKRKNWSIVVIDEGPAEPGDAHTKYIWGMDHEPFRRWTAERGVTADQLTARKLQRLMKRLQSQPWRPLQMRPGGVGDEIAGNQLDYPEAERADVLLGLTAFAADDTCALHLARLYSRLPRALKALGSRLGDGTPAGVRASLKSLAVANSIR